MQSQQKGKSFSLLPHLTGSYVSAVLHRLTQLSPVVMVTAACQSERKAPELEGNPAPCGRYGPLIGGTEEVDEVTSRKQQRVCFHDNVNR
ncbi:hypothetical protein INR49_008087 [Caranx melampygus]|nr:hypothetical protein INR49_008087 [Caranx melampygus]